MAGSRCRPEWECRLLMPCPVAHVEEAEPFRSKQVSLAHFPEETLLLGSAKAYLRNGLKFC